MQKFQKLSPNHFILSILLIGIGSSLLGFSKDGGGGDVPNLLKEIETGNKAVQDMNPASGACPDNTVSKELSPADLNKKATQWFDFTKDEVFAACDGKAAQFELSGVADGITDRLEIVTQDIQPSLRSFRGGTSISREEHEFDVRDVSDNKLVIRSQILVLEDPEKVENALKLVSPSSKLEVEELELLVTFTKSGKPGEEMLVVSESIFNRKTGNTLQLTDESKVFTKSLKLKCTLEEIKKRSQPDNRVAFTFSASEIEKFFGITGSATDKTLNQFFDTFFKSLAPKKKSGNIALTAQPAQRRALTVYEQDLKESSIPRKPFEVLDQRLDIKLKEQQGQVDQKILDLDKKVAEINGELETLGKGSKEKKASLADLEVRIKNLRELQTERLDQRRRTLSDVSFPISLLQENDFISSRDGKEVFESGALLSRLRERVSSKADETEKKLQDMKDVEQYAWRAFEDNNHWYNFQSTADQYQANAKLRTEQREGLDKKLGNLSYLKVKLSEIESGLAGSEPWLPKGWQDQNLKKMEEDLSKAKAERKTAQLSTGKKYLEKGGVVLLREAYRGALLQIKTQMEEDRKKLLDVQKGLGETPKTADGKIITVHEAKEDSFIGQVTKVIPAAPTVKLDTYRISVRDPATLAEEKYVEMSVVSDDTRGFTGVIAVSPEGELVDQHIVGNLPVIYKKDKKGVEVLNLNHFVHDLAEMDTQAQKFVRDKSSLIQQEDFPLLMKSLKRQKLIDDNLDLNQLKVSIVHSPYLNAHLEEAGVQMHGIQAEGLVMAPGTLEKIIHADGKSRMMKDKVISERIATNPESVLYTTRDKDEIGAHSDVMIHEMVHLLVRNNSIASNHSAKDANKDNAIKSQELRDKAEAEFAHLQDMERESQEYRTKFEKFKNASNAKRRVAFHRQRLKAEKPQATDAEIEKQVDSLFVPVFEKEAFGEDWTTVKTDWKNDWAYMNRPSELPAWGAGVSFLKHEKGQSFEETLRTLTGRDSRSLPAWKVAHLKKMYDAD